MQERTGAEIIIGLLRRQGIRTIAGIPGGAILPIYDALARQNAIRHVLCRHEQGAGFIAQGMARVNGRPGVCLATSGPGSTNLLTAIADAYLDSIPIIAITGQVPRGLTGTDAFQEVGTPALAQPITKAAFAAESAAELLEIIPRAFSASVSGRPGPVLIDVPKDVQMEAACFDDWPSPGRAGPSPGIEPERLDKAADMVNAARRPILYVGGGAIHAGAAGLANRLVEKASIPVITSLMALGVIRKRHPLNLGMPGMHGAAHTNMALEECDLLMAVGARFDDRLTGKVKGFCPDAAVVHIDVDSGELGKIVAPKLGLQADAAEALRTILPRIEETNRAAWCERVAELKRQHPLNMPRTDEPLSPYGLVQIVGQKMPEDAIIATDVGQHQMWVAQSYPFQHPRRWLTSGGLGTMGFGLPAAIGAALAEPDNITVCFSGDGSLLMNIQELATLAEENLNVKIVLYDNGSLGLVRQQQSLFCEGRTFQSDYRKPTDFVSLARDFGIEGVDLGDQRDPARTVADCLDREGPCLLRAPVDREEMVYPIVPPGAANRDMLTEDRRALACG